MFRALFFLQINSRKKDHQLPSFEKNRKNKKYREQQQKKPSYPIHKLPKQRNYNQQKLKTKSQLNSQASMMTELHFEPDDDNMACLDRLSQKYTLEHDNSANHRKRQTMDAYSRRREGELIQKREMPLLRRLVRKNKVQKLISNFILKLKRVGLQNKPSKLFSDYETKTKNVWQEWSSKTEGYALSNFQLTFFAVIGTMSIFTLAVIYSLALVFPEIEQYDTLMRTTQLVVALCSFFEIVFGFTTRRYDEGHALITLNEIALTYIRSQFILDFVVLVFIVFDLLAHSTVLEFKILRVVLVFKFNDCLRNLEMLQNLYITSFIREQYWSLSFVFITNFTFAHVLSVLLNGMANLNTSTNWVIAKGLENAPWHQRYIWGYYWGTTTMLTVGYGDFIATNYQEAVCLIFIEMISCITLSYNINCVGNLINNLRQEAKEKNKNMKTFQLMAKANSLSRELENKISNYIEQSFLIKSKFNFNEEDQVLEFIPSSLKKEYLKEINKKLFGHIPFLKNLTNVIQQTMAQSIQRMITHPEQIILKKDQESRLLIIQTGSIGLTVRRQNPKVLRQKSWVIEKLSVRQGEPSKLLTLSFIKSRRLPYHVKSLTYSILYHFQNEDFINILKQNTLDYEHYCLIKDKQQIHIDSEQLYPCEFCTGEHHFKFDCPKLHFLPNKSMVILRHMRLLKQSKQSRAAYQREREPTNCLPVGQPILEDVQQIRWDFTSAADLGEAHISLKRLDNLEKSFSRSAEQIEEVKQNRENIFNAQLVMDLVNKMQKDKEGFWTVETDEMHDWKHYFVADNPKNLKSRRIFKKTKKIM